MSKYRKQLDYLSRPQKRGFSEILDDNNITSSIESVLLPLYSCIQVIQVENPSFITIPELILKSSPRKRNGAGSILGGILGGAMGSAMGKTSRTGSVLIDLAGALAGNKYDDDISEPLERSLKKEYVEAKIAWEDDINEQRGYVADYQRDWDDEDSAKQEAEQAVDDKAFDLYCKCRQLIDVAKGKLKPEEEAVLNQIISRTAGKSYRERYDELLHPKNTQRTDDKEIKPLVLPDDFFHNPNHFDPAASVIGALSEKVLRGGGQRFAIMIECLASKSFGYIQPTFGNKRLLAARLSGCKLETSYSEVEWIDKKGRSVSETEKVMLWLTNYLYGGGYDRAYEILNFERHVKPGQETANLKNADKILRDRISLLYLNV